MNKLKMHSPDLTAANGPGVGRALVETARGLLLHEITLDGDRIADYVIVAPTEWNFHPRGRLHDWLLGLPAGDERDSAAGISRLAP